MVEATLMLRCGNIKELKTLVEMLEMYPKVGQALKTQSNIESLTKKAQGLEQEIQELEARKASLMQAEEAT